MSNGIIAIFACHDVNGCKSNGLPWRLLSGSCVAIRGFIMCQWRRTHKLLARFALEVLYTPLAIFLPNSKACFPVALF